jgi:hypothetical protein
MEPKRMANEPEIMQLKNAYFQKLVEDAVNKVERLLNQAEIFYLTEKTRARFDKNWPVPSIPDTLKNDFHKKFDKQLEN